MKDKRAALYLRVSTTDQTVSNQRVELKSAAATRGWTVWRLTQMKAFPALRPAMGVRSSI